MTAKEFLGRSLQLDEQINSYVEELDQYRRLSMNISGSNLDERVSHSPPNEAPFVKWVEQIVDKEKEINEAIDRLVAVKVEISNFIDKINNPKWQCLLRSRYVMCRPWSAVADDMNYGISSVYRIHKKILDYLDKKIVVNESQ